MDESDFGQHELLAKIGEGPRGPVFVARRTGVPATDLLYAVELSAFATGEDEAMRAFVRDVEIVSQLRHPNLLRVVEISVNGTGYYVVMDHVEGATLSAIQLRHRAIRPPRVVMAIAIDALHGLHAAHAVREDGAAQPLIHGSLSPEHLMIGLDGACRVTGFGNARPRVQTRPSHRSRTATGYMAPEQLTGAPVDPRTDVFSLGVILWNALTGKRLFHDRIEHMTMSNVLERKIPRPSMIGLRPPPALDAVVMRALERDPERRYQGAAEMAGALRDAARGAACLAAGSEVGEWITTSFGNELATRRSAIRELAGRPAVLPREVPALPPLGGTASMTTGVRDELSLDELTRAIAPLVPASATARPSAAAPIAYPESPPRRQLAIVAATSLAIVTLVLGWRWSTVTSMADDSAALEPGATNPALAVALAVPAPSVELEVSVLDVRSIGAATAAPAPSPPRTVAPVPVAPAPPPAAEITTPPPRAPIRANPATAKKLQRPAPPARVETRADPPEPKPPEPRLEPPPSKPRPESPPPKPEAPQRPTLEPNPYIYK